MNIDEFARRIIRGKIKLHKIGEALKITDIDVIIAVRRRVHEILSGASLEVFGAAPKFGGIFDKSSTKDELFIGMSQIPTGIVTGVRIKNAKWLRRKSLDYPMATTEEAMISGAQSASRITNAAGGIQVVAYLGTNRIARSSAFRMKRQDTYEQVRAIIARERTALEHCIRNGDHGYIGTQHARLTDIETKFEHDTLVIKYEIDPGDAAGHNMVTKVAFFCNNHLEKCFRDEGLDISSLILSGGICKDKNAAGDNYYRGIRAQARVDIPFSVCNKFELDPTLIANACMAKNYTAQAMAGGLRGNNSSVANPYTALSIALGQDPANVVEASQASTKAVIENNCLVFSVTGPLVIGTIGGGLKWPTQKAAMRYLELFGGDEEMPGRMKAKLAEVYMTAFLLSELSVHRSLTTGRYGTGERHVNAHNGARENAP